MNKWICKFYTKNKLRIFGVCIGLVNGLFGAGGGIVAIAMLRAQKLDQHKAHATAMSLILPLSAASTIIYITSGKVGEVALLAAAGALPGGLIGAKLMGRLSEVWLSRIFAIFMAAAGVRMFWS